VGAAVEPVWPPTAVDDGVADRTPEEVDAVVPAVDASALEAAVVVTGWLAASVPIMANMPDVLRPAVRTRAAAALWPRRRWIGRDPAVRAGRGAGASSAASR
jgi:hypothetical protein